MSASGSAAISTVSVPVSEVFQPRIAVSVANAPAIISVARKVMTAITQGRNRPAPSLSGTSTGSFDMSQLTRLTPLTSVNSPFSITSRGC